MTGGIDKTPLEKILCIFQKMETRFINNKLVLKTEQGNEYGRKKINK